MNKAIERKITKIYKEVYKTVFKGETINALMNGKKAGVKTKLNLLKNSKKYEEFAKEFSKKLATAGLSKERGVWRKYYEAAKAAHYVALPKTYTEFEQKVLQKTIKHNFKMIKSIPERMLEVVKHKYTTELINEVAKGTRSRGSFQRLLASHGIKQAKVIARTETAKLQTAITHERAKEVGCKAYIWLSSNDKRTRPSHRAMNGVIVFWRNTEKEKPLLDDMSGDAGEFPNCRCDAQPIVDITELTNSTYKVYNYNTHKIETMRRNKVIEALKKGEI